MGIYRKLNCNPGNYQCGNICQSETKNCYKNAGEKESKLLETVLSSIKKISKPMERGVRNDLKEKEEALIKKYNIDRNKLEQAKNNLKRILDGRTLAMSFPYMALEPMLNDGGKFKTQFETNESRGLVGHEARIKTELETSGLPTDLDPKLRPKYGHLYGGESMEPEDYRANNYGEILIEFDDKVKEKTSFTLGDSLDKVIMQRKTNEPNRILGENLYAGPLLGDIDLPTMLIATGEEKDIVNVVDKLANISSETLNKPITDIAMELGYIEDLGYIECQIHDDLDMTKVKKMKIPEQLRDDNNILKLIKLYPNLAIEFYELIDDNMMYFQW